MFCDENHLEISGPERVSLFNILLLKDMLLIFGVAPSHLPTKFKPINKIQTQTFLKSTTIFYFNSVQFNNFSSISYFDSHYRTPEVFIINKSGESTFYIKVADM